MRRPALPVVAAGVAAALIAVLAALVLTGGDDGASDGLQADRIPRTGSGSDSDDPDGAGGSTADNTGDGSATIVTLGEGNTGAAPDLDAPLPSLSDVDLAIRPTTLDFGPVVIGEERRLEVAVFNNSDQPFDLGAVTVAGLGYGVNASGCAPVITARGSCVVTVTFVPQTAGVEPAVVSSSVRGALAQATGDGKVPEDGRLTVAVVGSGSGTVTSDPVGVDCSAECTGSFVPGATVTLTAAPAVDSRFIGWSGADCGPEPICSVILDGPKNVLAVFDLAPPGSTLTVDVAGNGSGTVISNPPGISCPGTCAAGFEQGTEVTLTATPADGSTFVGWQGGSCPATQSCTITVGGSPAVLAVFQSGVGGTGRLEVDLAGADGAVTADPAGLTCDGSSCVGSYGLGTEVTLTAVPADGAVFAGWGGAGCPPEPEPCVVTVAEVTLVLARFEVG